MAAVTKTYSDLINDCDSLPYDEPFNPRSKIWSVVYQFFLGPDPRPHGFMLPPIVLKMPWTKDFQVNHENKTVHLHPIDTSEDLATAYTTSLSNLIQKAIDEDTFDVIGKRHSEPFAIIGANYPVSLERYASSLLGIISRGAHLTAYTHTVDGLKIWVPRRSPNLFTYPNCLDTTVAGGLPAGEDALECIVREAEEEASMPEDFVRKNAKACGCISYVSQSDERGGGEMGLISPSLIFVYDIELPSDFVCRQNDDEVKEFYLMTVEEVTQGLFGGEFKTNSAIIMMDFFIRHGIITPENEPNYAEIVARLHRRLPLPTAPA